MAKTIDEYAEQAAREIGRWYGALGTFERYVARERIPTCAEFMKGHWRRFPATDPTGGKIVDHKSIPPLIGF